MTQLVPYSFTGITDYPQTQPSVVPGETHGVYITLHPEQYEAIFEKVSGWFADRDEVVLIDHGSSDKVGLGYIILEWNEREIDHLFLAILRDEEVVADYTTYIRCLEEMDV